jgi:hypothetical protein
MIWVKFSLMAGFWQPEISKTECWPGNFCAFYQTAKLQVEILIKILRFPRIAIKWGFSMDVDTVSTAEFSAPYTHGTSPSENRSPGRDVPGRGQWAKNWLFAVLCG